ncbi:MAG: molybdate ABC transporter substrate-binding protein [Proteobacteria bacterium]|nr:molybdate ABC transporter substrate-binding protein [Pseudomonadota bacterium]
MMELMQAAMLFPARDPVPSVETPLHSLLPYRFIAHTHDVATLSLSDTPHAEENVTRVYGDAVAFLPYARPGFPLARALGADRLAMGDPDAVPAGIYGKQALTRLGVWPQVEGKLARAENVRAALALVARGEAPLGVVYATDARAEPRVRVVGVFPPASHAPIVYPIARLKQASSADAEPFRRFLLSGEGKALFRRFGFGTR